jgi:imidazolonepropionase-like amidohydrolase
MRFSLRISQRGRAARTLKFVSLGLFCAFALASTGTSHLMAQEGGKKSAGPVLIQGATIWTMGKQGILENADIILNGGAITRVGKGLRAPGGALIIDGKGKHVTPGLIDAHSHTAGSGGLNEGSNNITAEVRVEDVLDNEDISIYRQLAGGLTSANVLHGSANSIGGQNAVIKLRWPEPAAKLLFRHAPQGIKFALGENPKRSNFRRPGMPQRYPNTRMGVAASIRKAFVDARDYQSEWKRYNKLSAGARDRTSPPRKDLQLEALVEILDGKRLVHSHSYRQDEILMLLRLAEEFGFKIATFQHVLEGYKVADEIAAHGAGASTFSDWWGYKAEAYDAIPYNGTLMADRGVLVSFNSDSGELARRMNLEAAKAIKYGGLSEVDALALVTINPARQLRIDEWVGSLEKGKDADVVIWSGHPLSTHTICEKTWVDGIKRFDRAEDLAARDEVAAERAGLIERVKNAGKPGKKDDSEKGSSDESESDKSSEIDESDKGDEAEGKPSASGPQAPVTELAYRTPEAWTGGRIALVGGTVHPASGSTIHGATVLIEGTRIAGVGTGINVPADAETIDASGLHIYPGMIDADTVVGLVEINSVPGTVDTSETGSLNPEVRVELAINPDSELIAVTRANGVTHVLTAPRGGLFSGRSSLVRLAGWTWEDLSAAAPAALHMQYPSWRGGFSFATFSRQSDEEAKKEREKSFKKIKKFLAGARAYGTARVAEAEGGPSVQRDPALEAMRPVLEGRQPIIIHARRLRQIKHAVEWAEKEGLRIIIAGGNDSWRVAGMLKAREIPVILGPILTTPSRRHEPYDTAYTTARKLHEAGVSFAISTGGSTFGAANTRNLPYHAAMAASFGLDREEALRAVTLNPARILGVAKDLGSIEPGKSASLVVTDGDLLEIRTQVKMVFIDGKQVDTMNKHRKLYEKYKSRPRKVR